MDLSKRRSTVSIYETSYIYGCKTLNHTYYSLRNSQEAFLLQPHPIYGIYSMRAIDNTHGIYIFIPCNTSYSLIDDQLCCWCHIDAIVTIIIVITFSLNGKFSCYAVIALKKRRQVIFDASNSHHIV